MYTVILVDTPTKFKGIETATTKIEIVVKGHSMVGLRYRALKPTLIINAIKDMEINGDSDLFCKWWEDCVRPLLRNTSMVAGKELYSGKE
jgi:hypothetical protein